MLLCVFVFVRVSALALRCYTVFFSPTRLRPFPLACLLTFFFFLYCGKRPSLCSPVRYVIRQIPRFVLFFFVFDIHNKKNRVERHKRKEA